MTDNQVVDGEIVANEEVLSNAIVPKRMDVDYAVDVYRQTIDFVKKILVEGTDYGKIPGTQKPTLYKAGAEKFQRFFGFSVVQTRTLTVEQWDVPITMDTFPVFSYTYEARLLDYTGTLLATCEGNCNSLEDKYRWRWAYKNELGQYAKIVDELESRTKGSSTQYRIPNHNIYVQINTLMKMAQKRSYVGVVMIGANASAFYTQDMEDILGVIPVDIYDLVPPTLDTKKALMKEVYEAGIKNEGNFVKKVLEDHGIVEYPDFGEVWKNMVDWVKDAVERSV